MDCSQTLYEFRASNPKALNVLEGSGVFTTYQLQVNYRSNQEILDFANVALQNIEANQYAHIQLRANSLQQVTEQSFTDKVHFKYHRLSKISDFDDRLTTIFANDLKPYMDACLARGEQVALLAFTRKHVAQFMSHLKMLYPNAAIASLVPEKMYNVTIFSMFVKNYWDEVQFIPAQSITDVITRCIMDRLQYLTHDPAKAQPKVADMLDKWVQQYGADIAAWERQYLNAQMSLDDFLDNVKRSMLKFEISQNAIKQHLLALKNEETKNNQDAANADFVLSTIHSAKGLEFDNVIIIYRNDNDLAEDKKRMYYVAFTRAMRSEYIVAYDTVGSPNIEADYRTIVENLHKIAPRATPTTTAIANARAILAAQKAGQAIQSIPGVPQMASLSNDGNPALDPVSYSRDILDAGCISSPIDGKLPDAPVVLSKAFDPGAAIMAAQSIIAAVGEEPGSDDDDEQEDDTVFEAAGKAANA